MSVIDADTHVDESESTWAALEGTPYAKYMPVTVTMSDDEANRAGFNTTTRRSWVVEGRLQNRAVRDEINHPPRVRRELDDVEGRVAHMDEMGVDIQVIFPTFFIRHNTDNAEAEWALATTYNRWLAEKCAPTNGRLQWAAVLPWLSPEMGIEELRWAKEHGACGIFKRGFDIGRKVTDPHFFPVYEEANRLDMSLCIHTGHPLPSREWDRGFPIMYAFAELVTSKVPEMFPNLRFGFIESGASWIPYVMSQLGATKRAALRGTGTTLPELCDLDPDIFRKNRCLHHHRPHRRRGVAPEVPHRGQPDDRHGLQPHRHLRQPERTQRGAQLGGRGPDRQRPGREDPQHQLAGVLRVVGPG